MVHRSLVTGFSLGLAALWLEASSFGQPAEQPKESQAGKLAAEAKALAEELKQARETVKRINEKAVREKLELQISRAELRAVAIQQGLEAMKAAASTVKSAMSDTEFQALLKGLQAETFDKDKVRLTSSLKAVRLTCQQLKTLLKAFAFDDGRITAGLHLYPMLTDPENVFTVYEVFTFGSKKDEFRDAIGKLKK